MNELHERNELDVLRAARPRPPAPADAAVEAAKRQIRTEAARPRRLRWPVFWSRLAVAGGLTTALAVAVTAVPGDGSRTRTSGTETLLLAARTVRQDPAPVPRPGQWVYLESREKGVPGLGTTWWQPGEDAGTPHPTTSFHIRSWTASDSGRSAWKRCAKGDCSGQGKSAVIMINGKKVDALLLPVWGWAPGDQRLVHSLPTEAGPLLREIYRWADQTRRQLRTTVDRDQQAFLMITELMNGYVSPPLRAALYEALARIPGVAVRRDAVDLAGRHGIGITRTAGGKATQLIVDRTTFRFLGERVVATSTRDGVREGTVLRWSAQLRTAVVDRAEQVPK